MQVGLMYLVKMMFNRFRGFPDSTEYKNLFTKTGSVIALMLMYTTEVPSYASNASYEF